MLPYSVPTYPLQLEAELSRLEDLKRVNMQKFIEATRAELAKVWDQCFFGQYQRQEFSPYYEGTCHAAHPFFRIAALWAKGLPG